MRFSPQRLTRFLRLGFGILAAGFFLSALLFQFSRVARETDSVSPDALNAVFSMVLFLLSVVLIGIAWWKLLTFSIGGDVAFIPALRSSAEAWLLRYVPSIGTLIYKNSWLVPFQASRADRWQTIVRDVSLTLASSVTFGLTLILLFGNFPPVVRFTLAGAMVCSALSFGFVDDLVQRRLRRAGSNSWAGSGFHYLRALVLVLYYVPPRALVAWASAILIPNFDSYSFGELATIGGAYVISAAIGMLIPFLPSGIGAREGVFLLVGLWLGFDQSDLLFCAIWSRLMSLCADGLLALLLFASSGRGRCGN